MKIIKYGNDEGIVFKTLNARELRSKNETKFI